MDDLLKQCAASGQMSAKQIAETFDVIDSGGCAPPILASKERPMTDSDLDLAELERLAKAVGVRNPDNRQWYAERDAFLDAFTPQVCIALIARLEAAETDRDEAIDCIAEIVRAKEAAGFIDTEVVDCLRTMQSERDAAKAAGIAEGLERAAKIAEIYDSPNFVASKIASHIRTEIK